MYRYINPNPPETIIPMLVVDNADLRNDTIKHVRDLVKSIRHWAQDRHVSLNHALNAGIYAGRLHALMESSNQEILRACQADIDEANKLLNAMIDTKVVV